MSDEPTRDELVDQAEAVLESVKATMYYPVAHGEAQRLQNMIEGKVNDGGCYQKRTTGEDDREPEEVFRDVAEEYDMNHRDVEVVDREVVGIVDSPVDGTVRIGVNLDMARWRTLEENVDFMMSWYAGESPHREVEDDE